MALFELTLLAKEAEVETLSDALMEIDALSVSVEDADADTEHEEALWGEPGMPVAREAWQRSTLKCLFPSEAEALEAATLILSQDWATDIHVQGIQPVDEQDWVRLTQSQFKPVPITAVNAITSTVISIYHALALLPFAPSTATPAKFKPITATTAPVTTGGMRVSIQFVPTNCTNKPIRKYTKPQTIIAPSATPMFAFAPEPA